METIDPTIIRQFLNIFTNISLLILVSLGLYVIYGLMRVINLAHGEFVMLGAYSQIVLVQNGINFWVAVPMAIFIVCIIGALIEVTIIRRLYTVGGLSTLLATWGLSIVIQQVIQIAFGPGQQLLTSPTRVRVAFLANYPLYAILVMIIAWIVVIAFILMFKTTKFGVMLRASMDNQELAQAVGIHINRVYFASFVLGAGIAGLAGSLIAPLVGIVPTMGLDYLVRSFFVVIIGGASSIVSPIFGSFVISGVEDIMRILADGTIARIVVFVFAMIVMVIRPKGVLSK